MCLRTLCILSSLVTIYKTSLSCYNSKTLYANNNTVHKRQFDFLSITKQVLSEIISFGPVVQRTKENTSHNTTNHVTVTTVLYCMSCSQIQDSKFASNMAKAIDINQVGLIKEVIIKNNSKITLFDNYQLIKSPYYQVKINQDNPQKTFYFFL